MATCKNCLKEDVCRYNDGHNLYCKEDYECPHFKNKADVVEVVKCSECQKRYTMNCALWYSTFNDKEYFCGAMSNDNFFCAYGERKCDNENPN